jgi:hypothetical protein
LDATVTLSNKKLVSIIVATWIISLVSTIVVMNLLSGNSPLQIAPSTTKIVKLTQPAEMEIIRGILPSSETWVNFTWTPENPDNNMILSAYVYVEYRCDSPQEIAWEQNFSASYSPAWQLDFSLRLLDPSWQQNRFFSPSYKLQKSFGNLADWEKLGIAEWNQFSFRVGDNYEPDFWIKLNQNSYTTNLVIRPGGSLFRFTPTYIRNINVILEVIDG